VVIDPRTEKPSRDMIEHAIRGELDELAAMMTGLGPERLAECLGLCVTVSGYVAIDVSGHRWPPAADLRRIAELMADVDLDFQLSEQDAYDFLSRAVLGFEPLFDVFPDKGKAVMVPVLVTAALLASYRCEPRHWWEYLDAIERAIENAAPLGEEDFPAVLLLSRRSRALRSQTAKP
jgi:hypothetical protein